MQNENWEKVKELLEDVLELDISKRRDFLDNSGINKEIRAEIESLIAFETEAENLMNLSAIEFSKDFFAEEEAPNALLGQNIGVYRIIREIGYGGMGAVYLAERNDGKFEQNVALKMLKREMNTAAIRRRFQQEREILASLEHPNIARLLDAGATDDNTPYLAMEYIEGLPIDDYCHKHNLDLGERLDLFRQVCGAVNFAHRNLIVHRDLKPSNILVTNEGTPKLLDFGISKILNKEFEQINSATVTRIGAMTPSYASPEQLQRVSVTTSTDIYSLGIILYELLSGHRPFEAKEDSLKDIFQAVLETDPPLPSSMVEKTVSYTKQIPEEIVQKISKDTDEVQTLIINPENQTKAYQSKHTAPKLAYLSAQSLRGDLDNIVLKALRKEPERRYSSAENFAEDIHRYQRGLPVTARPNTFSYRTEKFIKRNSLAVAAGGLVIIAIIAGVIATLWQARIAQAERVRAEKRFNDVRTLANSFLFDFSPLIENLPGTIPARELLVKKALEYLDNLAQESGNDLELQSELAKAYEKVGDVQGNPFKPNIGDTKGALESYEKSKKIRESLLEKEPDNLYYQNDLSDIYKLIGDLHSNGGDYPKAAENYDKALLLKEKIVAVTPQNFESRAKLAALIRTRGLIPFYDGENKKAIEFYTRAQEIYQKLNAEQPENAKIAAEYAFTFVSIGEAKGWDNDSSGATINLQKGLEMLLPIAEKYPNDIQLKRSLMLAQNKNADNYQELKEFEKSIELFSKGLEISDFMLKADPNSFLAKRDLALSNKKLAQVLDEAGRSKESLQKLGIALKLFEEMHRADPRNTEYPYDVANTRYSIGQTYVTLKDYESARQTFTKAKEEFVAILEKNPENIYAIRMSSFNLDRLGKTYVILAEKSNRQEFLQKSLENLNQALVGFKKLKANGNLGEFDSKIIGEVEAEIEKVKNKMK